ncbi:uncharacterized protein MELLADRAFT_95462 [Melampsora larici-populina 98AG31]|uniref:Uncharacterized protein n=1 Tax=Melampsora larici-populina (strain 98AG31 / pathotype 3-4-7) TaxID=747676 RepID=F4S9F1_MELLP|nr:uncharacterized protein MELLADRAFT_95462 [Melampsora larici-populina 98AG31]EGF98712.1 hypothetical protein MELLADRAFT_95462 [Melampsora larici-populina 98AG31]
MSFAQNCISPQSFKIFSTLATSLLQLILAHREFYPTTPFLPWKHGSEPCEHIFGWMRIISPRFTVLDARMMLPKIHAIVKNIMSGKMKIPPSEHMHSGYQYAFSDEPENNLLEFLAKFPTDEEISEDLAIAHERANQLSLIAGMGSLVSLIEDVPGPDLDEVAENLPENLSDISVCATQHYNIEYGYTEGEMREKQALEAAAHLTKEQNSLAKRSNVYIESAQSGVFR